MPAPAGHGWKERRPDAQNGLWPRVNARWALGSKTSYGEGARIISRKGTFPKPRASSPLAILPRAACFACGILSAQRRLSRRSRYARPHSPCTPPSRPTRPLVSVAGIAWWTLARAYVRSPSAEPPNRDSVQSLGPSDLIPDSVVFAHGTRSGIPNVTSCLGARETSPPCRRRRAHRPETPAVPRGRALDTPGIRPARRGGEEPQNSPRAGR